MNQIDLWKIHDTLSIAEAALLIVNVDAKHASAVEGMMEDDLPDGYKVVRLALIRSLGGDLKGSIYQHEYAEDELDVHRSLINVSSLKSWLKKIGLVAPFFDVIDAQPYLNPDHPQFSPKLAAAVRTWFAIVDDEKILNNQKTAKQNATSWLTAHAASLGLVKDNGDINNDAIEGQIAKVVNWQDKGGAPMTPMAEPATPVEKPLNSGWAPPGSFSKAYSGDGIDPDIPF